ncbi:MAG: PTS sugar transporter subunit IIA [Rhodospirillaceae bacterium]|nr:PTS sugar transporter subunit IIA [Rhodospirillaceae bacterium]MDD9913837.1 PTS sugar transporter subunit IIA [Rhodospirillaceae bacterium]
MIGLVLVTHGRLAEEFVAALEHVVGPQQQTAAISIGPEDDMEKRRDDVLAKINEVDSGSGVIVLTDMFGGTPSNLAISFLEQANVEVVAGVNLPMLIKIASVRETMALADVAEAAKEAGRKYISVASSLLNARAN